MKITIVEDRKSEECGCPERELIINGVCTIIHFEPDGSGEAFFDTGDWQHELSLKASDIDQLQNQAVEWVKGLPSE